MTNRKRWQDLLSERTKMGLGTPKRRGGNLIGLLVDWERHKLNGKEAEIQELLSYRVSKSAIARKFKISRTCLVDFVQKRKINPA